MKSAMFVPIAAASLIAFGASAHERDKSDISVDSTLNPPARWADLHDVEDARFAITTRDRKVVLLLTDRAVAMQLSDRVLHKIDRKVKDAKEEEEGPLGRAIKTAVLAGVTSLLNHSAECDIRDIHKADYRDGELILTGRNGKRIFRNIEVDDENVMRNFDASDARAFARRLQQRMRSRG